MLSGNYREGFTLIELLTVVAITTIVIALAAPSFGNLLRSNRLTTITNDFIASLNIARSEAIKRKVAVTVCKSSNGSSCQPGASWKEGWLMFTDLDSDDLYDSGVETLIQTNRGVISNITLSAGLSFQNHLTFLSNGMMRNLVSGTFYLCDNRSNNAVQEIWINSVGRINVRQGSGTCT